MSFNQLRDKIVNEIPISELIERYGIRLTRKSTGHVGVCPFHNDTKPSMSVSDDKRLFKCFACGAGTSHFDFVMRLKSLSFLEALKDISDTFNLDFDSYSQKPKKSPREIFGEKILKATSEIYFQLGMKNQVPEYLDFLKKRDIPSELNEVYKLGFAPKANTICDYINTLPKDTQKGVKDVAFEIGLIKWDDSRKSHYDTFRDRIIFPIWDHFGKVIGFTSRAIHDYQKAKYMNSKESFIFNKRNLLYGIHLARPHIRKRDSIILVEGNMDQLSMYKKGFENSVAIMGTALGDSSLRAIKALTQNVILALDTDNAGWDASARINKQFLDNGIIPRFVEFSPHKDPDDFLKEEGSIALKEKVDNARSFIDVQFDKLLPKEPITILNKKLDLLKESFALIAPLKNDLNATERLISWAKKIGLESSTDQIIANYNDYLAGQKESHFSRPAAPVQTQEQIPMSQSIPPSDEMAPEPDFIPHFEEEMGMPPEDMAYATAMPNDENLKKKWGKVEKTLLSTIIEHPQCLEYDKLSELLDFMGPSEVKEYVLALKNLIFEIDISEYKNFALETAKKFDLEEPVRESLHKFRNLELDQDNAKKLMIDLERKIIRESLKVKKAELRQKHVQCNTEEELSLLMTEIHTIEKKLYSLSKD